ncbi:MAG: Thymidine kinase [Candidatus Uhrbacteria bacterium GW2011_GWD2_52_7]|uniref:Thymidine kinase n=1 Tax=Candidatus Uhrbacteria bacterium GW2011_GWD2_52_7 TaxID=1618989 RepID=A0A0G1XIC9_9BACT|nr:MAG: Thymidine kinase [Candidatus Uhrbacteria bacterium GW2011_GWD2_52_7]
MFHNPRIRVICGCMSSGKSKTLMARITPLDHSPHKYQLFTSVIDPEGDVHCRDGIRHPAIAVENSLELLERVEPDTVVVAIDEGQFFDHGLVGVVQRLARSGRIVYIAGLDLDWEGNPFGPMAGLLAASEHVEKLTAWCTFPGCKATATLSQRIVANTAQLDAGQDKYVARCLTHWDPTKFV